VGDELLCDGKDAGRSRARKLFFFPVGEFWEDQNSIEMTKWPNGNRWKRRWRLQSSKCREGVLKMRCCNKMQAMEAKKKVSKRTMVE